MRRLVSRRGNVIVIKSDNRTNFVGASNYLQQELENVSQEEEKERLLKDKITWTFIPPRTPHMGRVWERQAKTVKEVFQKLL